MLTTIDRNGVLCFFFFFFPKKAKQFLAVHVSLFQLSIQDVQRTNICISDHPKPRHDYNASFAEFQIIPTKLCWIYKSFPEHELVKWIKYEIKYENRTMIHQLTKTEFRNCMREPASLLSEIHIKTHIIYKTKHEMQTKKARETRLL